MGENGDGDNPLRSVDVIPLYVLFSTLRKWLLFPMIIAQAGSGLFLLLDFYFSFG